MAAKNRWEEYKEQQTAKQSNGQQDNGQQRETKKNRWEEYKEKYGGTQYRGDINTVANNIVESVNAWLTKHNAYVYRYKNRYANRKYSYEDAYVRDSGSWLDTVSKQKSNFDAEADSILAYMDQFSSYLDEDWMKSVRDTLTGARGQQSSIVESATKDNEYWLKFTPNEEQAAAGYTAEKIYSEWQASSKQYADDLAFDVEAGAAELEKLKKEREDFLAEQEEQRKQAQSEESWLDKVGRWLGNTPDTSLPVHYQPSTPKPSPTQEYDNRIAELEEQIERSKYVQGYEGYMANMDAPHYAANSRYRSTRTDVAKDDARVGLYNDRYDTDKLFGDFWYDYINGNRDALGVDMVNNVATNEYFLGLDKGFLKTMTKDEVGVFNAIYKNQGPESAYEFVKFISSDLTARERAQEQAYWAARAKEDPVGTSVFSVLTSPTKALTALGQVADYLDDGTIDQNAAYNRHSYRTSAIRNQVAIDIEKSGKWGKVGSWTYQLGMSMGDFLMNSAVSGGNSAVSLTLMGSGAMADTVIAAKDRGLDDDQAMILGVVAGAAEVVTEKFSLDALFKGGLEKGAMRYILTNAFTEGTEEVSSSVINLVADVLVSKDKSEWQMAINDYLAKNPNATEQEAFQHVLGDTMLSLGLDFLGGSLMGGAMGSGGAAINYATKAAPYLKVNKDAVNQYGGFTKELIDEGLASDINSRSYDLAKYYEKKTAKGKSLSGYQIRSLVEANEAQFAVENYEKAETLAKKKLTELGETGNIGKIAKLVAKRATGQELTASEKSTLVRSQYGAQVAKEMTTPVVETQSGPKSYNATYKSLEDRVGTESRFGVSESGTATIRKSNEEISLDNVEVVKAEDGQLTVKLADGREVYAGDIDFADDTQAYAFSAVADIENITPAAATAIIRDLDLSKPVGAQLNGIDEAYTYGYHGYSVADLKAGQYTSNLTNEQMMSAYKLGQSARTISDVDADAPVVKMRTAAEKAVSKKEKVAKQKAQIENDDVEVYFQDGKSVVKFDEHTGKYDDKRMAAVNTAKFLSKLNIGGKYYFFESYVNDDGVRVYKDSNGNEVEAPNGMYKDADGSIHIDLNAGNAGQGIALFTMGHELTHFIKAQSKKQFKVLCDLVAEAFDKTNLSMHERVVEKQEFLSEKRGYHVSYNEAYEEVVADAMSTMLTDGSFYDKLMEIKVKDKGLFNTIKRFFEKMIAKFNNAYKELSPEQRDARDIREMKDMFDRIQTAFAEALVEASENFQASETVLAQSGVSVNANTDSGSIYSVRDVLNESDRNKVAKALAERFGVTVQEAKEWLKAETSLASLILNPKYSAYLDYDGDPNEVAIKQNSDYPQGTVDFSNICKKRREFTQVMNRILRNFPNHVFAATDLAKIRTIMGEEGMTLPCGICYVEDRRQLDTIVAQDFIEGLKLYREGSKTRPDGKPFNANQLKGLQLTDGDTYVPSIYELVTLEGRNSLKTKNPNMEAAWVRYNNARGMQAVRLLTNEAEYKIQILKYSPKTVQSKNDHGGLRIYSFSDAEMFHLIDIIQVITDSAAVGLSLQGYTKVNEYAKAVKDTGEKLNRSLIPKGDLGYHMENGKVVLDYDTTEGIDIYSKDFFDNKDNPDVGNITIGINDVQIRAAMVSDFVDQIIPFHTGQSEEVLGEKGIAAWVNYKDSQTEKDLATGRTSVHQVNIYTEVFQAAEAEGKPIQNKRQFVEKFLQVCKENGLQPRFSQFLNTDANGDYIYTEGYHKFLVDFKTFAQTEVGEYLPQMPVKPIFDDAYITGLLEAYVKEQQAKDAEVAKQMPKVIERITNEIVKPGEKHSDRTELSPNEYNRLTSKKPINVTAQEWAMIRTQRKTKYSSLDENDIPIIDFFMIGDYRIINNGFIYYIRNSGPDDFSVVMKKKIVPDARRITREVIEDEKRRNDATNDPGVSPERGRRGPDRSSGERTGNGRELSENDRGTVLSGEPQQDLYSGQGNADSGTVKRSDRYSERDSSGKQLTEEQLEYFEKSMARDRNGSLQVVYHGGTVKFEFDTSRGAAGKSEYGPGAYFTESEFIAKQYSWARGGNVKEYYLNIERMFDDTDMARTAKMPQFKKLEQILQRNGIAEKYIEQFREYGFGYMRRYLAIKAGDRTSDNWSGSEQMNALLQEAGFDGVKGPINDSIQYAIFAPNQAKLTTNEVPSSFYDTRYSERGEGTSNRSLLANAFEGITNGSEEYKLIQQYKGYIAELNSLETKLSEFNRQIREIRFGEGKYDAEKLKKLESEAKKIAESINKYDQYLLSLEASAPLRKVIEQERKKEAQKTKEHVKEIQQNKKLRAEQTELRHKIQNFKKKLEAKLLRPTDRQYVPVDLIKAMVEVCDLIDTDTDFYKADGSINKAQAKRDETKEKLQNLRDEYEKIKDHADPMYAGEFDDMVYTYLKELREKFSGKSLKEMSVDDLAEMYEILRSIDETLADAIKLIGWGDAENVYEAGDSIVAEQNTITKKRKNGKRNAVQKAFDKIDNLGLSPVRNAERMSGYNQDSALLKLFKKFEQGIRKKNKFQMEAYKRFESLTSGKEYDDALYKKVGGKQYTDVKGRKFGISKMQMMQAILSWEREMANKNLHHIEKGGFTFADLDKLRKGNLKEAVSAEYSHRMPAATEMVAEFKEILKDDKWCQDYMAAARSFFNGMAKDAINETSIALKHRIIAKDKSYIPFEVDTNFVNTEITDMDAVQKTINSYGMLKDTKDNAPQALYITGLNNILDRHIEQVSTIYGLAIEVRNFNKVWNVRSKDETGNNPTVKESIDTNWGKDGVKHIEQAVKDIQGPRVRERNALYDKIKSGYIGSTFLLNLSVVTKQNGSLFSATSMLKWRSPIRMLINLYYTMARSQKIAAEVDKYTASAWMRRQGMSDAELYTLMTQARKPGVFRWMSKAPAIINPTKWITARDHAVALSLWKYAKQDTAKRTGLKGEELLKATAEFYDEVIENTQSMTDVLHRPEIQKRGDVISESFSMFKTDLYQMAGQLQATAGRFAANRTKENGVILARTVCSIAMSAIWGQLMTTVFALLRYKVNSYEDDEEDELTVESWMKRQVFGLSGDLMGYIFPIFGSEVVGIFESIMYGESDDAVDNIVLTAINDLYNTMITVGTSIKDGEWPEVTDVRKLAAKALQVFGIPANNILRALDAIQLHAEDIANGEFFSFNAGLRSNNNKLYDAIVSGDKARLADLKSTYVDKKGNFDKGKYDTAVRTGLKENDPRIREAAQARVDGNIAELQRIYHEIKKEGKFDPSAIMDAIYSMESDIRNELEPDKVKSQYDTGTFLDAVLMGEIDTAQTMRNDIIDTHKANGKTQKEAEDAFESSLKSSIQDAFLVSELDEAGAKNMLMEYTDMEEEDAASRVDYWAFCDENPKYAKDITEAKYNKYKEFAEPAEIPLDVFVQYLNDTKGLATVYDEWGDVILTEQEQVKEAIHALPLTWQQKDALYLSYGYAESGLWDVPW